jgi:hypothetical protein
MHTILQPPAPPTPPTHPFTQAKEREKKQLLDMCNELMTRLEREGLAA